MAFADVTGRDPALETSHLQLGAGWPYSPARGLVAGATSVPQARAGSTRSPVLKSPSACTWGWRSTGRDDLVLDGGTSGAACGCGCGGGILCRSTLLVLWARTTPA